MKRLQRRKNAAEESEGEETWDKLTDMEEIRRPRPDLLGLRSWSLRVKNGQQARFLHLMSFTMKSMAREQQIRIHTVKEEAADARLVRHNRIVSKSRYQ